jgi:hypothetical protein
MFAVQVLALAFAHYSLEKMATIKSKNQLGGKRKQRDAEVGKRAAEARVNDLPNDGGGK